ncbi:hypothetical protein [Sphingomonas parva]|nr:hypothetical protein [Sphingomonas parva]
MTRWNKEAVRLGGGSAGITLVALVLALVQVLGGGAQAPML